jgi:putative DNA primase/helicase
MVSDEELKDFLGEAAQKMGIDKFDARFHMFRESLYKQFLAIANAPKPNRPCDTVVINLQNGTFEIKPEGGFIRKFRHEDFITYQLPFDYKPGANASLFNSYLQRVLPDKERQKVLAEFLGYIFTQSIKLEKCLLLYGSGANGKSVFFDIINALLGKENVSNCSLADLNKEYNRAMLGYKLLNYGSEIKGNAESDIFKQLVSGEPIQACRKYCDPFIMRNYAKLCFNCNELPKDVEHTEAYFRRFLIIPFDVTIPEDERNPQLAQEIIQSELSGVFNWILEGLSRLMAQGNFSKCEAIKQQIVNYKTQSDSVYLFLEDEGYQKSDSKWCLLKEMYPEYKSFCMNDGYRPVSKSNFKKRLESFGYLIERRNVGWAVYAAK